MSIFVAFSFIVECIFSFGKIILTSHNATLIGIFVAHNMPLCASECHVARLRVEFCVCGSHVLVVALALAVVALVNVMLPG